MRPLFCANDLHLGAVRSGGTTPGTALALRRNLLFGFQQLLDQANGCNLLINGDWFDATNVPLQDMFAAMHMTADWLAKNSDSRIYLPPGNHDLAKNTDVFSSFDFVATYLQREFPQQVMVPRQLDLIVPVGWVVPHMPNQDLFELELKKVPPCDYLFLHCNYDNRFATQSDHSLNLSPEMAAALPAKVIVIGHEHQHKTALDGKVILVGNQFPSSVADCLGNDTKFALKINGDDYAWIETWYAEEHFAEIDWRDLTDTGVDFVRVVGQASTAEAAAVVSAIAKFRQKSKALVITNAVSIDGIATEDMAVSLEQVQSFNVMGELMNHLNDEERVVVKNLLEKQA